MNSEQEIEEKIRLLKIEKLERLESKVNIRRWRKNPLLWLKERFNEDPKDYVWSKMEGYENHQWDGDVDPLAKAWFAVVNRDDVAIESASSVGKTRFGSRLCYWFSDVFENSLVIITGPTIRQVQRQLWMEMSKCFDKFQSIRPQAKFYKTRLSVTGGKETEDESWQALIMSSGVGSDEELSSGKARGYHAEHLLVIVDECPGISFKVLSAFETTLTADNNIMVCMGNPDNIVDPLHLFSELPSTVSVRVSALDHPNIVSNPNTFPAAVSKKSIEKLVDKHKLGSPFYNSMARGLVPQQSEDSLIKLDWFEQCVNYQVPKDFDSHNALGCDPADSSEGDDICLAWGKGNRLLKLREFSGINAAEIADNVCLSTEQLIDLGITDLETEKVKEWGITQDCIGVDTVGIGASTKNQFKKLGFIVVTMSGGQDAKAIDKDNKGKLTEKFSSGRSQWYWQLRQDLKNKEIGIFLEDHSALKQLRLHAIIPKYKKKGGVIYVESKEDIKKRMKGVSPNDLDAVVYWNWVRKDRSMFSSGVEHFGTERF